VAVLSTALSSVAKILIADASTYSITKEVVGKRFSTDAKDQRDMLGSFIRHSMTRDEAESETVLQMIQEITLIKYGKLPGPLLSL
jgi:hypothetical protein